ncbi:unnamed protein product [Soboliphyme baturini]|uniref:PX domain-containing protein n=1 Tax=Soboliphyme baturini TaxID=241478 RepID=A0A183J2W2_9BILA|nr:unnamed protein product [Soboliphyme baturini]
MLVNIDSVRHERRRAQVLREFSQSTIRHTTLYYTFEWTKVYNDGQLYEKRRTVIVKDLIPEVLRFFSQIEKYDPFLYVPLLNCPLSAPCIEDDNSPPKALSYLKQKGQDRNESDSSPISSDRVGAWTNISTETEILPQNSDMLSHLSKDVKPQNFPLDEDISHFSGRTNFQWQ